MIYCYLLSNVYVFFSLHAAAVFLEMDCIDFCYRPYCYAICVNIMDYKYTMGLLNGDFVAFYVCCM